MTPSPAGDDESKKAKRILKIMWATVVCINKDKRMIVWLTSDWLEAKKSSFIRIFEWAHVETAWEIKFLVFPRENDCSNFWISKKRTVDCMLADVCCQRSYTL